VAVVVQALKLEDSRVRLETAILFRILWELNGTGHEKPLERGQTFNVPLSRRKILELTPCKPLVGILLVFLFAGGIWVGNDIAPDVIGGFFTSLPTKTRCGDSHRAERPRHVGQHPLKQWERVLQDLRSDRIKFFVLSDFSIVIRSEIGG